MQTKSLKFKDCKKEWLKDPEFKKEYDGLQDEFNAILSLIEARNNANLTQAQVAEKMGIISCFD